MVSLFDADQPGCVFDRDGGRWVTHCDKHGGLVNHDTKQTALWYLAHPDEYCEPCRPAEEAT
jgi:hypothetical protein